MAEEKKNIAGLWIRKMKSGKNQGQAFIAGDIITANGERVSIRIFKNTRKRGPKHPDYLCYVGSGDWRPQQQVQEQPATGTPREPGDEDIVF